MEVKTTLMPLTEPPFKRRPGLLPERSAQLVVTPHPLTQQGQTSVAVLMEDGETLLAVLQRHGVTDTWIVEVGGLQVPALMWGRTRVHHAQVIECRPAVQKEVVKIIAFAALAYFTMGAGNAWIGTALGTTSSLTIAIAGALVFAAGAMVINKLLPPPKKGSMELAVNTTEPTYSLSGGRNQMRIWQPMSLVLGQPYVVPDLAGQPYSFFSGQDQYLVQQFHAGINCHGVSNVRIGQTPVESYQGVSFRAYGLPGSSYPTGLPNNSVDTIAGGLLDAPSGYGPWVQRTTSPNTLQIGIDLEANVFAVNATNGAYEWREALIEIQYRATGSADWIGLPTGATYREEYTAYEDGFTFNYTPEGEYIGTTYGPLPVKRWRDVPYQAGIAKLTNSNTSPLRVGYTIPVAAGQYDVRLRKLTTNETSTSAQNTVQWTQLKSFQQDLSSYPGQSIVAMTAKASGQLSGAVDELNWIATAKPMPYWDGSAWTTATNRTNGLSNPGAQILQLARGIYDENGKLVAGLGWPDSRIDVEGLKRFMVWCAAKNLTFDAVIQDAMSHEDLLGAIAYAGLATISWSEGRLGVQWLDDAQPVEGVINMGNIKARSFSVSYDTNDRADEIEYGYFDRNRSNSWNSLRVIAPGVSNPRTTARLSNMGITSEGHAAMLARHAMAQNIYMAKSITFEQDLEFLTYRRGTVLALSHDMTQWGYSGRIQSATESGGIVTLTLDDTIPATGPDGASSRYIGLRLVGETQYRVFTIAAFTGSTRTVTLASAWPSGVALPGSNGQPLDALWIYDFKATPGQRVVVAKVEPTDNMAGARVTVVPLPDEFWPYVLTGAYTPPPNISLLNRLPNITGAYVTEILKRQGNTWYTELTVSFTISENAGTVRVYGAANGAPLQVMGTTDARSFTWVAGLSESWDIELRPFNGLGQIGGIGRVSYTVRGLSAPPPDVASFTVSGDVLSWSPVNVPDLAGYRIRFNYGQNTWWATAADLHDGLITESPYTMVNRPTGPVTLLIKAVDTTGNESVNAAQIVTDLGDQVVDNIINEWPQHPLWTGTKTGCTVVGAVLQAIGADAFYGADDAPFYGSDADVFFATSQSGAMQYEFSVYVDASGRLSLTHQIVAANYTIEYQTDDVSAFFGADANAFYGADADPFFGSLPVWKVWPGWIDVVGAQDVRFRITTLGGAGVESIQTLSALLDVPDVTVTFDDLVVSPTGTRLTLPAGLTAVKNVKLTVQADGNGGASARYADKQNLTLGPLVTVLNASGTPVTGLIDAVVQAY